MSKKEQSMETRSAIIRVGRDKFAKYGFDKTSMVEIVEELGLTRGAFYHHFNNKEALFSVVIQEIQEEIGLYVDQQASSSDDQWDQLVLGSIAFVEKATDIDISRILLIDGPRVVTWERWKKFDSDNSVKLLVEQLEILREAGLLKEGNIAMFAHIISGGLNELALSLGREASAETREVHYSVRCLLEGFRAG